MVTMELLHKCVRLIEIYWSHLEWGMGRAEALPTLKDARV